MSTIPNVFDEKKKRKDQRTWMRRRLKTARVHNKRRVKRANHLNGGTVLTCIIDALEKRDAATTDIPGVFMQADMGEIFNMKMGS